MQYSVSSEVVQWSGEVLDVNKGCQKDKLRLLSQYLWVIGMGAGMKGTSLFWGAGGTSLFCTFV